MSRDTGVRQKTTQQMLEETYRTTVREYVGACKRWVTMRRSSRPSLAALLRANPKFGSLDELDTWIHPERYTAEAQQQRRMRLLEPIRRYMPVEEWPGFLNVFRLRKGPKIQVPFRRAAIEALDVRRRDRKNFHWQPFTDDHCPCGKAEHLRCKERIRQPAMQLQRLLRKAGHTDV